MDASANALLHCIAVARDASASSVARASVRRSRLARSSDGGNDATLDDCRIDAAHAERALRLNSQIEIALPDYLEGSRERNTAERNLHNIRRVLAWYDLAPE